MSDAPAIEVARRLAVALDHEDYIAAAECLSPWCTYRMRSDVLEGPEAILASYRENGDWASAHLDSIEYDSSVRAEPDRRARITYSDDIRHGGERHVHTCEQIIEVDDGGLIHVIEHVDLPGEPEALAEFFARAGVDTRSK